MMLFQAAGVAPIKIKCGEIGNCAPNTPTLDVGLANILHALIGIVGGLAFIFIIVSGLQMVLSAGNAKRYQMGRESLLYACVGVVLAIVAWAVVDFIAVVLK